MNTVKRTEKGWGGHFVGCNRCMFRRHTMLEYMDITITVSTVGNWMPYDDRKVSPIASIRHFETMAFHSLPVTKEAPWKDADLSRGIMLLSPWQIRGEWKEQEANDMHEKVVDEIILRLLAGDQFTVTED